MNIALIIAGGVGARMHQDIPKQFLTVNERPVIIYTLEAFERHPEIDAVAVVCIKGWEQVLSAYAKQFNITKLKMIVPGGKNGQDSIRNGVYALEKEYAPDDFVLIHDAIRPMVSAGIISECIRVAKQYGNAVTAISCAEAMLETRDGFTAVGVYPRDQLMRTQTPQAFRIGDICDLHPRFFADIGPHELSGLGLSCEAVCELLLQEERPLCFADAETCIDSSDFGR